MEGHESVHVLERRKAALTAKAKEYQKELDELTACSVHLGIQEFRTDPFISQAHMPEAPPLSITELVAFRKELKKQEQVLKEKRAKVEAFQGLPPVRISGPEDQRDLTNLSQRTLN